MIAPADSGRPQEAWGDYKTACRGGRIASSEVCGVLLELARPVTLLASMISLLALFHAAFLGSETDLSQRIWDSAGMLLLAAGISLIGGLVFQGRAGKQSGGSLEVRELQILASFPVRVFCWGTGLMAVLFLLAWYMEGHILFHRFVRF